jgi:SNF2 family DNA or RNA helicase
LLADDPGAGKTIMAGLLIKGLIARGDLQRCLVVCPGSLAEQWQDELRYVLDLQEVCGSDPSAGSSSLFRNNEELT